MNYQLAAFDMDGTLLTDDKRILPETVQALREADLKGKSIALCTGRPLCELGPYRSYFDHVKYGVLESGACVYDFRSGRELVRHAIPKDVIPQILRVIAMEDAMPQVSIHGQSYVNRADLDRMDHFEMGMYETLYRQVTVPVDDVCQVIRDNADAIGKLNIYHVSREASIRTHDRLEGLPIERVYSETTSLELSPAGVNKGVSLRELAVHLGIPMEEVLAVGDADNDLPALRTAGFSVAMQNANDHVLAIADAVTADNNHDGCGEVIRKYLLS